MMLYVKTIISILICANCMGHVFSQSVKEKLIIQHPSQDRYASYSPDSQRVLFESDRSGNWDIFVLNMAKNEVEQLTIEKNDQRRPSWHPHGDRIMFESALDGKTQLIELNLITKERHAIDLSQLSGQPIFAQYSPNGEFIALSEKFSEDHAEIVVIDVLGDQ